MKKGAVVAVVMGSDSDFECMSGAVRNLEALGIRYEVHVMSAHRTPEKTAEFAKNAAARGLKVLIVGAGGAAHLPGVIASMTLLPTLGVPIPSTELRGMDALLSIVQMPAGVPVATLGIGESGAGNAALLAAEILAVTDAEIRDVLQKRREEMKRSVEKKDEALGKRLRKKG
jgi:5-(carboxyamino)imidazole ribonucleotide mutase